MLDGNRVNLYVEAKQEVGDLTLSKSKVTQTLPLKIRMAPRDLWDEDSTQDIAPGLDIIDFKQYFEADVNISIFIEINNN